MNHLTRTRAELYARAEYYAWSARKGFLPAGRDPLTGYDWTGPANTIGRRIARAENIAAARVCYAAARTLPCPLP